MNKHELLPGAEKLLPVEEMLAKAGVGSED